MNKFVRILLLALALLVILPSTPLVHAETDGADTFRDADQITLYPFTEDEMTQALQVVGEYLDVFASQDGVLSYTVENVAYDPMLTDHDILEIYYGAPVDGWDLDAYYAHYISFSVTHSAAYDHAQVPNTDREHAVFGITLYRADTADQWEFLDSGTPVTELSGSALSAGDLDRILGQDGEVYAGYRLADGEYYLYLRNGDEIRFAQVADPEIAPEGSTESTAPAETTESAADTAAPEESREPESPEPSTQTPVYILVAVIVVLAAALVLWMLKKRKK